MTPQTRSRFALDPVTLTIFLVCFGVEALLQLSDRGFLEVPRLRQTVYEYAGFWPGLLRDWRPNYEIQPALMFLTYGFLHGGLVHFFVNMITHNLFNII